MSKRSRHLSLARITEADTVGDDSSKCDQKALHHYFRKKGKILFLMSSEQKESTGSTQMASRQIIKQWLLTPSE